MIANFEECLVQTLKYEGGYVNDPHDPGGATNKGITQHTLSHYFGRPATIEEVKHIDLDTVRRIYSTLYWHPIKGDALPAGVDLAVFDFGVNSGPLRAVISLQRAVNVADDGVLGPRTLEAVLKGDALTIVNAVTADRLKMLSHLHEWPRYKKGWSNRVANIHRTAESMVHTKESTHEQRIS